jgi:hypothetical protein
VIRRDRFGESLDDEQPTDADRHYCRAGWTGEDEHGRPIPCLICKPHLPRFSALITETLEGPR